ncbi:MAG: Hpt domain-containing protein, partial [Myxococcota bacterium]|nr:Hpt domain-containing protein [Myxococcota bacterium]
MSREKPTSLEARLSVLRKQMEDGFPRRAAELRAAVDRLAGGEVGARAEIRRLAHKLRGTAGSYGHTALGEQAGDVEVLAAADGEPGALVAAALGLVASIGR